MRTCNLFYISLISIILLVQCKPSGYIITAKYPGSGSVAGSGFIYALPRTTLIVDVDVVRTTKIKGPYADFAKRYLAIEKVIRNEETTWEIGDMKISGYQDADPNNIYMVKSEGGPVTFDNFFDLTEQGFIIDLTNLRNSESTYKYLRDEEERLIDFKDLTVSGNIGYVKDTLYRLVFKDSAFIKVPMLKNQVEAKSLDQKAQEAADFIFEIRNQRLYFISGENGPLPESGSFHLALKEMSRLEDEYLSLFIGKVYTDTIRYSFEVIPTGNTVEDRVTLFRFSEELGVFNESIVEGTPVVLEFQPGIDTYVSKLPATTPLMESKNTMYYRVAGKTKVKISMANQTLMEDNRLIYQYGKTMALPMSVDLKFSE